jgi:hypothetical protein
MSSEALRVIEAELSEMDVHLSKLNEIRGELGQYRNSFPTPGCYGFDMPHQVADGATEYEEKMFNTIQALTMAVASIQGCFSSSAVAGQKSVDAILKIVDYCDNVMLRRREKLWNMQSREWSRMQAEQESSNKRDEANIMSPVV